MSVTITVTHVAMITAYRLVWRERRLTGQFSMALRIQKDKRRTQLIGKTTNITVDLKTITNNIRRYIKTQLHHVILHISFNYVISYDIILDRTALSVGMTRE